VVVIETDKVNLEIRAPKAGTIGEFFAAEGDTVRVGMLPNLSLSLSLSLSSVAAAAV
jgi:multidrug resistance efflux pump